MKKRAKILVLLSPVLVVAAVVVASIFSTLWSQEINRKLHAPLINLDSGWSIKESESDADLSIITMRRVLDNYELKALVEATYQESVTKQFSEGKYIISPTLLFVTHSQNVIVYVDNGEGDKQVYSYGTDGTFYAGSEGGNAVHTVHIPFNGKSSVLVTVKLTPSFSSSNYNFDRWYYKMRETYIPDFKLGWGAQTISNIFFITWFQWVPVIILLFISFAMLMYFFLFYIIEHKHLERYLKLSLFTLGCALVFIFEIPVGFLYFRNSFIPYFLSTVIMALEPYFSMVYLEVRGMISREAKRVKFFKFFALANAFIVSIFAFITVLPFGMVRSYIFAVLLISGLFKIVLIIYEIVAEKNHADFYDIVSLVTLFGLFVDLIMAFISPHDRDIFTITRWTVVGFAIVFGMQITKEFFTGEISRAKAKTMKQVSMFDFVTGFQNGTMLWRDPRFRSGRPYGLLLVGVAGFLEVRNKYGIPECENIQRMESEVLKKLYPPEDLFYLTGSKIAAYIPLDCEVHIEEDILKLKAEEKRFNDMNHGYKIGIEAVYSEFIKGQDVNMETLYSRMLPELLKKILVIPAEQNS